MDIVSSISPDNKSILTGSTDYTARLWDMEGNQLQVFRGHEDVIYSAAFSPDGKTVLTGSGDRTARLFDVKPALEDFQKSDNYEHLNISQKIEYDILDFKDVNSLKDIDELYEAADYYYQASRVLRKDSRIEYLNNAVSLYNKLLLKEKKTKYYIALLETYKGIQEIEPADDYLAKQEKIYDEIKSMNNEDDLKEGAEYFIRLASTEDDSINVLNYNKALLLFEKILENFPDTDVNDDAFTCYNNIALAQLFEGQYLEALNNAKKGLELEKYEIIYTKLALAYLFNDQFNETNSSSFNFFRKLS